MQTLPVLLHFRFSAMKDQNIAGYFKLYIIFDRNCTIVNYKKCHQEKQILPGSRLP